MSNQDAAVTAAVLDADSSFNQLYLYGLATRYEVYNHLRTQAIGVSEDEREKILSTWQVVQKKVADMKGNEANIASTIKISEVPAGHEEKIQSYTEHPAFKKAFTGMPIKIFIVEIDKLVGAQRTINLDYVKTFADSLQAKPTMDQLLDLCVCPNRADTPVKHLELNPNLHMFSSPNTDLRFLGGFKKPIEESDIQFAEGGGIPIDALMLFVGYGTSTINAFLVNNDRVVLNNGFHRVYALRAAGIKEIPIAVQTVSNFILEMPPVIAGIQREYLCGDPRPPILKDYFDPHLTIQLKAKNRIKIVMAQAQVNQVDIPV